MYCLELFVSDVFPWVAGLPDVVLLDDLPEDGEGQRPQQLPPLREAVANLHDFRLGRLQMIRFVSSIVRAITTCKALIYHDEKKSFKNELN